MTGGRGRAAFVLTMVMLPTLVSCGHTSSGRSATRAAFVVGESAGAFDDIRVRAAATGQAVVVPADLRSRLAPLVAARVIAPATSLAEYGLDRPTASIDYLRANVVVQHVVIGDTNFDAHGFYVQRAGDATIYLVLSADIRPVVSLVGITTPAPR